MADPHASDPSPRHFRRGRASEQLRDVTFPLAVRGYDRRAVDDFVDEVRALVADLEAHQTREGVVQKTLDELGEETAGILQRAHETADEIAARSRAQADGRVQRAEREAEIVRREADEYSEQVVSDTRLLWEERQRLIEDIRHLADEVLATADDAIDRLKLPEPLARGEEDEPEPTTSDEPAEPIPHPLSLAHSEPDEEDPSVPYDLREPEEETDPDATHSYEVEAEEAGHDPDATVAWRIEDEDEHANPVDQEESGHTVELEALPGGNSDDTPGERERD
jgi:DivIVA domain-containing protein